MNYIFILWSLLALQAFGRLDQNYDPASNQRPGNLTDFPYYLYSWIGSYYNGTAVFNIDYRMTATGDDVCPSFRNKTTTFSAESILAINKVQPQEKGHNPVQISLKAAETDFSFADGSLSLAGSEGNGFLKWKFLSSVGADDYPGGHENSPYSPYFNLSPANGSNSAPYEVTGTCNDTMGGVPMLTHSMSTCSTSDTTAEWTTEFIDPMYFDNYKAPIPFTPPKVNVMFSAHSAHFSFGGWVSTTRDDVPDDSDPFVGWAEVEFLGRIDPLHSDILRNGTSLPSWMPTVGFGNWSANMQFESGAGVAVVDGGRWLALFWVLLGVVVVGWGL